MSGYVYNSTSSVYGSANNLGDWLSLARIFGTLMVLAVAASRTKTFGSLQTEMLAFVIILFTAEIPEILNTLGYASIAPIQDFGSELHAVSMVVLTGFVGYRVYGFSVRHEQLEPGSTGDQRIVEAIRGLLASNFGTMGAKAIDFYADANIAISNPEEYTKTLTNVFGKGTGHVLTAITQGLAKQFGISITDGAPLDECINLLGPKAQTHQNPA